MGPNFLCKYAHTPYDSSDNINLELFQLLQNVGRSLTNKLRCTVLNKGL